VLVLIELNALLASLAVPNNIIKLSTFCALLCYYITIVTTALVFSEVPGSKLRDASFWFLAFRPLVYASASNSAAFLYERLLPYTNCKPLYCNVQSSMSINDAIDFVAPPFGGSPSKCRAVLTAVRHTLRLGGLTAQQAELCDVLLRQTLLQMVQSDLSGVSHLRGADVVTIRLATRELARTAAACVANPDMTPATLLGIRECVRAVEGRVTVLYRSSFEVLPPQLNVSAGIHTYQLLLPANTVCSHHCF
jgi:hypothetical protein